MSEIKRIGEGGTPMPMAAEVMYNGKAMMDSGTYGRLTITTAANSTALAIVARSSLDPYDGTAETLTAGDEWPVFLLGCGKIVEVASITAQTWADYALVYLHANDGQVSTTSSSARPIGRYMGIGVTTAAAGELIPVWLCVAPGESTG